MTRALRTHPAAHQSPERNQGGESGDVCAVECENSTHARCALERAKARHNTAMQQWRYRQSRDMDDMEPIHRNRETASTGGARARVRRDANSPHDGDIVCRSRSHLACLISLARSFTRFIVCTPRTEISIESSFARAPLARAPVCQGQHRKTWARQDWVSCRPVQPGKNASK